MLNNMPALRVVIAFSILLLIGGERSVSLGANRVLVQQGKAQDWRKVQKLLALANDKRREERLDRTVAPQRKAMFIQAAAEYRNYINKYLRDETTVEYVTAVFELGLAWENADRDYEAKVAYDICNWKEAKNSPRATHNGAQLAPQLRDRLAEVNLRLGSEERVQTDTETHKGGGGSHEDFR